MADTKFTGLSSQTTPADTDIVPFIDLSGTPTGKKITWANIKVWIKSWIVKADVGLGNVVNADTTTTTNITDATNKRFVTDAELVVLGNTSGTNTGDQSTVSGNAGTATALQTGRTIDGQTFDGTANITVIAPGTHAATSKTTPVDADELPLVDSAASNVLKKLTWANLKATLKTYFDSLTTTLTNKDLTSGTNTFPTFNQNTTGSAAKLTTARTIAGVSFDGTANIAIASTNLSDTSSIALLASTQTFTNKRNTKRVGSTTSSATPTINTDNVDVYKLTAQTADITSFTTNLSGTPNDWDLLMISITGTASRAITWGTSFEASTKALPTTTSSTATLDILFRWNVATSKWRVIDTA